MRVKDENKNDAIFAATIDLLNEIGFAGISMSKIAKRANVSSSTIYVYFKNKDDMLRKTYIYVKRNMHKVLDGILDDSLPVKEAIEIIMRKTLKFLLENKAYFLFCEQFDTSPLMVKFDLVTPNNEMMTGMHDYIDAAKQKGLLKNVDTALLIAYFYYPIAYLAKVQFTLNKKPTKKIVDQAVEMTWQAIKA